MVLNVAEGMIAAFTETEHVLCWARARIGAASVYIVVL
jgi:hypothetical protein